MTSLNVYFGYKCLQKHMVRSYGSNNVPFSTLQLWPISIFFLELEILSCGNVLIYQKMNMWLLRTFWLSAIWRTIRIFLRTTALYRFIVLLYKFFRFQLCTLELEVKCYVVNFFFELHHSISSHSEFPLLSIVISSTNVIQSQKEFGGMVYGRLSLGLFSSLWCNWEPLLYSTINSYRR